MKFLWHPFGHEISAFVFDATGIISARPGIVAAFMSHVRCYGFPWEVSWLKRTLDIEDISVVDCRVLLKVFYPVMLHWPQHHNDLIDFLNVYSFTYISRVTVYNVCIYIYVVIIICVCPFVHVCTSYHGDKKTCTSQTTIFLHRWLELRYQRPPGKTTSQAVCCRSPGFGDGGGWI